jgi:predicted ATPase/class 3 adenylate cyclase
MAELPSGTVTFLFTDIEGSTRLWEEHPEAMREALGRHDALLREAIGAHQGRVFKTVGDQFCAAFTAAPEALAAALTAQRALHAEPWPGTGPLRVRMALHTGTAEAREGDYLGPPLNRIARLLEAGHGGQILLSLATQELVRDHLPEESGLRDLEEHRLKDLTRPERVFQLLHPDLPADFPPLRSLAAFAHNLPAQLTSFIGREQAMAEVKDLLSTTRLLTLTGSGGCGKTRLALQVAVDLLEEYAEGVWLVELAPLADPALVPQTVLSALGVREETGRPLIETLVDYLQPKSLLLILDNCEHLLTACAQLADHLLRCCPKLQILASSREGLGIAGEQTYRVPSLALPDARHLPPLERLHDFEAVQLFADRARASQATFAVTPANAPSVAQVCQRLDGIPLAIELAAARVKALPVEQIAARLDDMFRLLTGGSRTALPRQQTLRALIDWSYNLLTEAERTLLRRLSVFAGGWTLEAAEAVCPGDGIEGWEVLDLLTQLVDKSLVVYLEQGSGARYRLLETVRQYARDRLLEASEGEVVRDRHRDWFVALAEQAAPHLQFGSEERTWMDRLERDHDNLRAALEWCQATEEGGEAGLRLAGALTWFWYKRGHKTEGWQRASSALSIGSGASAARRGKALTDAFWLALFRSDFPAQATLAAEALALGREAGDPWLTATALHRSGMVAAQGGDLERAQVMCEEGLSLARQLGDRLLLALLSQAMAIAAQQRGDYERARTFYQDSLDHFRGLEDSGGTAVLLTHLGWLARQEGNDERARALWSEALALWRGVGDRSDSIMWALHAFADLALAQGDLGAARACYEEALAIARELNDQSRTASALLGLARVARAQGEHEQAWVLLGEAQALGAGNTDIHMECGHLLLELGDPSAARSHYEEGLALRRARGDAGGMAWALLEAGHAAWLQGEPAVTQSHAAEALGLFQEREDREGVLAALEGLAVAALAQGRKPHAARLLGAAEALREALKLSGPDWWRRPRERIAEAVRAASLEQEFAAAWAEGRAISLEQAVEEAFADACHYPETTERVRREAP